MNLIEDFEIHDHLNEKIFSKDNKLLPEVRKKIIQIVSKFEDYSEVPMNIVDIQLVGSNASYNYTSSSDLDVHIISNFELVDASKELLQQLYNMKKSSFNDKFDIKIRGIDVELYVQDIQDATISNGIYSVCSDEWIKEPKPIKSITKHNIDKELEKWQTKISSVLERNNYDEILDAINMLYLIRHNSLVVDGEYGKGNALFKEIRSKGLMDKLKDALHSSLSTQLSLESLTKGQIVNSDF